MKFDTILDVDPGLYPLECVLGAGYCFLDRAFVKLDRSEDGTRLRVSLKAREPGREEELEGAFLAELLNQTLRTRMLQAHGNVRELILEQALRGAAGAGDAVSGEDDDYADDPLGIAVPWEEKYGKEQS